MDLPYRETYPADLCSLKCPCADCKHPDENSTCGLDCWGCHRNPKDFPCTRTEVELDKMC